MRVRYDKIYYNVALKPQKVESRGIINFVANPEGKVLSVKPFIFLVFFFILFVFCVVTFNIYIFMFFVVFKFIVL